MPYLSSSSLICFPAYWIKNIYSIIGFNKTENLRRGCVSITTGALPCLWWELSALLLCSVAEQSCPSVFYKQRSHNVQHACPRILCLDCLTWNGFSYLIVFLRDWAKFVVFIVLMIVLNLVFFTAEKLNDTYNLLTHPTHVLPCLKWGNAYVPDSNLLIYLSYNLLSFYTPNINTSNVQDIKG